MSRKLALAGAMALGVATAALAATWQDGGGTVIPAAVLSWINGSNVATPVSTSNPLPVSAFATANNPSTIYANQQICATTAVALPSQALVNGVVVKSLKANTGTAYLGPSGVTSATGYPLSPGEAISYAVTNLSAIYLLCSNATDAVAFTGN